MTVNYANNLSTEITAGQIAVALTGNAFDPSSVDAGDGFYNSNTHTVTWDQTSVPDLAAIQPGDHGTLDFSFQVAPLYSPGGSLLISPSVGFSVSIQGKQSDAGGSVSTITGSETKTAVVSSDLGFSADAFYSTGPFANTGPVPPQAGQPTTYTITWTITNTSNSLSGATASAQLPTYVDWVGTTSPASENISFDSTTRTVNWNIGQITPGTGTTGGARTASFQVRLNSSSSQVGTAPSLILGSSVTAKDTYTGETVSASRPAVSTQLANDPAYSSQGGEVSQ